MDILLWGAGEKATIIYRCINKQENNILGIIDINRCKSEKSWVAYEGETIKLFAPEIIDEIQFDYIVVTPLNYEPIKNYIVSLGCDEKKIICFWKENSNINSLFNYLDEIRYLEGENIKYKARYENAKYELQEVKTPIIMSNEATIDSIISDGKSIARFGDGEWDLMFERKRSWFQKPDTQLAARLNEVMNSRNDNILVALADNFGSLEKYNDSGADGIRQYMVKSRDEIEKILDYSREYASTHVTRPYLIYKDKSKSQYIFDKFKELWANRNVVSIEGKNSKFGVGNDLLDNAKSVKRVLCPQSDAFSCYDKILNYVLSNIEKDKLVIISLGPTATVLAYDLAMNGYQAIDIGHLDNEYEWFLRKANDRVNIPGKHVSEVEQSCHEEDDEKMDSAYRKSILTCIE